MTPERILTSIVICTYNRSDLLALALKTLCQQTIDPALYEVIVVDNNSTDDTRATVEKFQNRGVTVRYCLETQQGLSHARNRGWREAQGEYVAYTDDDCKLPPQWLTIASEIVQNQQPVAFGGPYYPFYLSPKPSWFKDSYGTWLPDNQARAIGVREYLVGGNIFIKRTALVHLQGFSLVGMTGNAVIAYGDETELQIRLRRQLPNEVVYDDPQLFVYHLVRPEKMTWPRLARQKMASGRANYQMLQAYGIEPSTLRLRLLRACASVGLMLPLHLVQSFTWRDRQTFPYIQNFWYEKVLFNISNFGFLREHFCPNSPRIPQSNSIVARPEEQA